MADDAVNEERARPVESLRVMRKKFTPWWSDQPVWWSGLPCRRKSRAAKSAKESQEGKNNNG
jgi:hypothetical protein